MIWSDLKYETFAHKSDINDTLDINNTLDYTQLMLLDGFTDESADST